MNYTWTTAKPEWINIRVCPTTHVLISDNLPARKKYFDSNIVQNENARLLRHFPKHCFEADVDSSTSLHTASSRREICALRH